MGFAMEPCADGALQPCQLFPPLVFHRRVPPDCCSGAPSGLVAACPRDLRDHAPPCWVWFHHVTLFALSGGWDTSFCGAGVCGPCPILEGGNGLGSDACFSALLPALPFPWDASTTAAPPHKGGGGQAMGATPGQPSPSATQQVPSPHRLPSLLPSLVVPLSPWYLGCAVALLPCILPRLMKCGALPSTVSAALSPFVDNGAPVDQARVRLHAPSLGKRNSGLVRHMAPTSPQAFEVWPPYGCPGSFRWDGDPGGGDSS